MAYKDGRGGTVGRIGKQRRPAGPARPSRLTMYHATPQGPADHPTRKARIKRASLRAAALRKEGYRVLADQPKRTKWWQKSPGGGHRLPRRKPQ